MAEKQSLKWLKLLGSIVIIGLFAFIFTYKTYRGADGVSGFTLFAITDFTWGMLLLMSPLMIVLRLFRIVIRRRAFIYLLAATLDTCLATYGLMVASAIALPGKFALCMALSWLFAAVMMTDIFVRELPDLRRTGKNIN
jgi:hypothetical protein